MKLGLNLRLGYLGGLALALAMSAAGACGRTDLFSAHGGPSPGCTAGDPSCVPTDGGGLSTGRGGNNGGGGNSGGGGNKGGTGGGGKICPTGNHEICGNKIDDDCNGLIDCADPACFGDPSCSTPGQEICNNGIDDNGNGLIDCADPECFNSLSCKTTPGMEICNNGIDDNGNGLVDCADPMCTTFPGCLTVDCSVDTDFGTLAAHGASVTRMVDTTGAANGYATCAPTGGLGRVGRFELDATADVRLTFTQAAGAAHVVELFRAGANETCDRNPLTCVSAGDAAMTAQTFSALPAGVYWLIVESYPQLEGSTTVTLSTGSATTPEICNNGIDDDGNGLIDCADSACFSSPFCVGKECVPDVNLGTLVVGAPAKEVQTDLSKDMSRYRPTCSGTVPGGDEAIEFTLAQPAGIEVAYQESGSSVLSIFQMPTPGLACDADQLTCTLETGVSNAEAITGFGAGSYLLIVKAASAAQAGPIDLEISAFGTRQTEICDNGIDDDGNGLIDCADPACFGVGMCASPACVPSQDLGALSWGTSKSVSVNTQTGLNLYETTCSRGNGKEQVLKLSLTEPMALSIDCTDTGSNVLALSQELEPLDACDAHEVDCADPQILPFGCGFAFPGLQPGNYYLIVQAFQAGEEGTVALTLTGLQETVGEICDNGIDDDGDGFIDCADRKCVTSPECAKLACRADQSIGLLPLNGTPSSVVVQTTGAGNNETLTTCVSQPGGQDADVDFQVPATADLTLNWAQVGNHDFAIYPNDGMLFACEVDTVVACLPSAGAPTGSHVFAALPAGTYHLVVDADAPGDEGGVVVQLSAVAAQQ
jgi:Putative metal-binding motif